MKRIGKHLNSATVLSLAALIFAMAGGAFAADGGGKHHGHAAGHHGHAATMGKKGRAKGKRGPRGKQGPAGPEGKEGPAGLAGPTGPAGKNGTNGTNGKDGINGTDGAPGKDGVNGKGVEVLPSAGGAGEPCEGLGGAEVIQEEAPVGAEVCNGQTGFTETLPSGETETGTWGGTVTLTAAEEKEIEEGKLKASGVISPISFPIPLGKAPSYVYVEGTSATGCPGIVNGLPTASKGTLCVYKVYANGLSGNPVSWPPSGALAPGGVGQNGGVLIFSCATSCEAWGSWAVTAE